MRPRCDYCYRRSVATLRDRRRSLLAVLLGRERRITYACKDHLSVAAKRARY